MLLRRRKMLPLAARRPMVRFFLDYDFDERAMIGWCGPCDETEK
jgi:hypothetical protein